MVVPSCSELPHGELAAFKAVADQPVARQIAGMRGRAVRLQVGGRRRRGEALAPGPDGHCDHVAGQAVLVAHTGVVAGGDDVDVGVVHRHFDADARVPREKGGDELRQHEAGRGHGDIEAQAADRLARVVVEIVEGGVDRVQRRAQAFEQAGAGLGRGDAAGGAVEQAHAEFGFEPADAVADRRGRQAAPLRRDPEAAGVDHGREQGDMTQVGLSHA